MFFRVVVILYFLAFLVFDGSCQNTQYQIDIQMDTSRQTFDVHTAIQIVDLEILKQDTIWIQLTPNAYSRNDNPYSNSTLKLGYDDFYFLKKNERLVLDKLEVSDGDQKQIPWVYKDFTHEFIGIPSGPSNKIHLSYRLKWPKYSDDMGIYKDVYYLSNFYPKLVHYHQKWAFSPHRFSKKITGDVSDFTVTIDPQKITLISNGVYNSKTFKIEVKNSQDVHLMMFKKTPFIVDGMFKSGDQNIPYKLIFPVRPKEEVSNIDSILKSNVALLDQRFNNYPFDRLTLVIDKKNDDYTHLEGNLHLSTICNDEYKAIGDILLNLMIDMYVNGHFKIHEDEQAWMLQKLFHYYKEQFKCDCNYTTMENRKRSTVNVLYESDYDETHYYQNRYQIPLNAPEEAQSSKNSYFHRFTNPTSYFDYIEDITWTNLVDKTLEPYLNRKKWLTPEAWTNDLVQNTGAWIRPVLDAYVSLENIPDYTIQDVKYTDSVYIVYLKNLKSGSFPFKLSAYDIYGNESNFLIPAFEKTDSIRIINLFNKPLAYLLIDKNKSLPDYNRENNYFFVKDIPGHTSVKTKPFFSRKSKRFYIFPGYNDNDRWMAGLNVTNHQEIAPPRVQYSISPMYSFKDKSMVGEAWLKYTFYLDKGILSSIEYIAGLKSFNMNHFNTTMDYRLRYVKMDPQIRLHFYHPVQSNVTSSLSFKAYFIQEESAIFKDGILTGNFEFNPTTIFRLTYEREKNANLFSSAFHLSAEHQSYADEQYTKLTGIFQYRWKYRSKRNIHLRLFASGFLSNTQRNSLSFQNTFTRGSIALIHQGFNDYTYDETFLSRQNQNLTYDNQVSLDNGGAFKTPVGNRQNIGMSNHFAAAINAKIDVLKSDFFPLSIYFDLGSFSTYNNGRMNQNIMYNGGFSLNFDGAFAIHIPLIFSKDLKDIYQEQHPSFFKQISFTMALDKIGFPFDDNNLNHSY